MKIPKIPRMSSARVMIAGVVQDESQNCVVVVPTLELRRANLEKAAGPKWLYSRKREKMARSSRGFFFFFP
jgi:hypothetical protein